jgi:hypothetical protein
MTFEAAGDVGGNEAENARACRLDNEFAEAPDGDAARTALIDQR